MTTVEKLTLLKDRGGVLDVSKKNQGKEDVQKSNINEFCLAPAEGEDDKCELPGCTKRKKVEGARVFDYCCRQHAKQDAPYREGIENKSCEKNILSTADQNKSVELPYKSLENIPVE